MALQSFFKKYIGDRNFYKSVLAISVPIMIQNGITNFVSLLDNIMVGQISTEAMSGVSIVNQFIFIFNLIIFGAISASGIFTSQFYGKGDVEGVRHTFRFKFIVNFFACLLGILVFVFFDDALINLFLHDEKQLNLLSTLNFGKSYLFIMLFGLLPYSVSQVYASTMRETGDTVTPMISSIIAVATNCILNAILIFGLLGFPALGVEGAAIATVISRFVELFILLFKTHLNSKKYPFIIGAYRSLKIPKNLAKQIIIKGFPLILNEFLWALAMIMRNQCYSTRGLDVVAAQNISSTLFNFFNLVYISLGNATAIIVGSYLGAGKLDEAYDYSNKLLAFSVIATTLVSVIFVACAFFFPFIYNTSDDVRQLATIMMIISSVTMPFCAYANAAYFSMRSGGKVAVTFIFDSGFMWCVVMPLSFILSYLTNINIVPLFIICQSTEIIKAFFGAVLYGKKTWLKSLVNDNSLTK